MRMRPAIVALAAVFVVAATPAPASARVPKGFVGMMADGPIFGSHVNLAHQLDVMVASGVESLRVTFNWAGAQPFATFAGVPVAQRSSFQDVGGVPTQWSAIDNVVRLAAERGLTVLPVVIYAPAWDAVPPASAGSPPAATAPYADFMTALVDRYGPRGTFWTDNPQIPKDPIRMWQIWNEPNLIAYWSAQPSVEGYVKLLSAAHAAVKAADPGAKVVLAGLTNYSWEYLAQIYKVPGVRKLFDIAAVHPYTAMPQGVIEIIGLNRRVMNRNGDAHKPILVTETGWPSSLGKVPANQDYGFATTEAGQARDIAALLPLLAAARRRLDLLGFYLYTWIGHEYPGAYTFNYSGLFSFEFNRVLATPAYGAFRRGALALEGCRKKGTLATVCVEPR
jgi:hypothetical protein